MRITGVNVQLLGAETVVQVTAKLGSGEEMDESDVQRILDAARELGGDNGAADRDVRGVGDAGASRDTEDANTSAHDENGDPVAERGVSRRRRGASAGNVSGEDGEETRPTRRRRGAAPAEADPEIDATDQPHAGTRRRRAPSAASSDARREDASTTTSPSDEEGGEETRPTRRRRGNTSTGDDGGAQRASSASKTAYAQEDEPAPRRRRTPPNAASAEENPSPSRGRRTSGESARGAASTKTSAEISDEELMKACSLTARQCGSEVVRGILNDFAVGNVAKVAPEDRQDLLDRLAGARASAAVEDEAPEEAAPVRRRRR